MQTKMQRFDFENVNGIMLSLAIDGKFKTPDSRKFTITYKSKTKTSLWPKISLVCAVIINIIGLFYAHISLTKVVITITVLSFLMLFWITHSVQSETVSVAPLVGIQSTLKYVLGQVDKFIPWTNVDDVVINEVIQMNRVLYFLTVLVKTQNELGREDLELVTLFKYTKPRLQMIEKIYCEMQNLLTETNRQTTSGSGDVG